ncbi:hypothetical protein GCM10009664_53490 [Kitasatospora gansuensis]
MEIQAVASPPTDSQTLDAVDLGAVAVTDRQQVTQHIKYQVIGAVDHEDQVFWVRPRCGNPQWVQAEVTGFQ